MPLAIRLPYPCYPIFIGVIRGSVAPDFANHRTNSVLTRSRTVFTSLVLLSGWLVCQADPSATGRAEGVATEVRKLVKQLDSDDLAEREAAEKSLVRLGPEVLNHLPAITPRTAAEVKIRLGRVRKTLELNSAASAAEGSTVTLSGKMPLAKALSALEEQTGNRVTGYEERDAEVEAEFEKTGYWEALDKILDQAGLTINTFGGEARALTISARPDQERARYGSAHYAGLFRFEITRLESVRDLRNPTVQGLKVGLEISWEPRLTPISIEQSIEQLEVVDDQGKKISVDNEQMLSAGVESEISTVELILPLELPGRESHKLATVRGTASALLPGRLETFEFSGLESISEREVRRAGTTVVVEQVRKNQDVWELRMRVRFDDAGNALESHRSWVFNNEAYLKGPDGERVDPATYQTTHQDVNEVGMAYLFDLEKGPKGYTFVYKAPASILRIPVKYELKDIPLP